MRASGARQRNRRNASPENLASARNAGSPARIRSATAQGEKRMSKPPKDTNEMAFCSSPKVRMTKLKGRREASRRARQLVVEFGILELRQIQRQRLLQNHDVDALPELRAQQRLRERDAALCHGGGGD